jgi:hypothetical protein
MNMTLGPGQLHLTPFIQEKAEDIRKLLRLLQSSAGQALCLVPFPLYTEQLVRMPGSPREPLRALEWRKSKAACFLMFAPVTSTGREFQPSGNWLAHFLLAKAHVWKFRFPEVSRAGDVITMF